MLYLLNCDNYSYLHKLRPIGVIYPFYCLPASVKYVSIHPRPLSRRYRKFQAQNVFINMPIIIDEINICIARNTQ